MAPGARAALEVLDRTACDVALVDLRLPDMDGLELLRAVRARWPHLRVVVVTGYPAVDSAVEALKLGAADYVAKRPDPDYYTALVERVLPGGRPGGEAVAVASGLRRWAEAMRQAVEAPDDTRTEVQWAERCGAAVETLRGWCRAMGLPVKASLDLARALRAVRLARAAGTSPERFLDVADRRTRDRLLEAAGAKSGARLPSLDELLSRQSLVTDAVAVAELRRVLRERGLG